ncbi:Mbeg1-like protein [Bifidobacterium biavatii]|uniref:Triacylglycerol lipase n=1 Tax=Bifidobacterium biavatii DSM 23969 TaxID=1437608 RepID=A0A086ZSE4_9BIFI|nr:Mbeg1-like protein [Bifidobacterium biavatii]KFI49444.1 triacylglycerol lipase [Bifidobacterium biavatii DSM 23969]
MGNILDYARTEFRDFARLPFSAVDSLVLSELAYVHMPEAVPRFNTTKTVATVPLAHALRAEDYPAMFTTGSEPVNEYRLGLLRAVCESPRYRGIRVGEYAERLDEDDQQQFSAMTFDLGDCRGLDYPGGLLYVAFRGTDGTLVGWKEDFNMAVRCPVPSQRSAADYLASVAARSAGVLGAPAASLMIGGHSKGGACAIWAAMSLAARECSAMIDVARNDRELPAVPQNAGNLPIVEPRIIRVYSHDGPGFDSSVTGSPAYRSIAGRIDKTVPEASVIGRLLDDGPVECSIVKADAIGILQHMGGSWQVADGRFVTADGLSAGAQFVDRTIATWLAGVDQRQREVTIDQVYDIVAAAGYANFADLAAHWTDALPKILLAAKDTDRSTRALVAAVVKGLPSSALRVMVSPPEPPASGELRESSRGSQDGAGED